MEAKHLQSPNPPSSSSLLRDISNFRTPKHTSKDPSFHSPHPQFFTASRETPRSSSTARRCHRPSIAPTASASRSKVARRLRAFELEQSKSARKAQIDKEKSLRSLAKSLTVWLNFLFENPASCGCDVSKANGEDASKELDARLISGNGKREGCSSSGIGVDTAWRCPKRQRDSAWRGIAKEDSTVLSNTKFLALQSSLEEVCSFDDLKQRMNVYLSLSSCNEIFKVMTQVTKNIDEGRLKMKSHCPIVTDVGLKEKAARILMLYNPNWLRIGLYVIFGGNSLLADGNANSEMEIAFLKMVIEKQFFSHAGLARDYAYNKLVEGLYRPGYFEILGNVILKRFLLLALVLDRAKAQSCLPIKYGIDGLDGGSPPLFILQSKLRSSHQVIHDFLSSDVMHGEGNLLAHLAIIGYKVSYLQSPLNEYDFRVTELFEDLRDGVRLCRAIQLLQHDTSILMKMVVPSDTHKKNVANCGIALQHLKQAGVPLFDEDGSIIVGEDIVCGDKELTLSLLWNIFIHLQLPLLINKPLLLGEISRIRGVIEEQFNHSTLLDMLLKWIQAICESYDLMVDDFASLVDGKAMWCLLDYYFRKELDCSCSLKDLQETSGETSLMSVSEYTDAVHNFILSQKLTKLLGKFPEVTEGALMLSTVSNTLMPQIYANNKTFVFVLLFLEAGLIPSQKSRFFSSSKDLSNYFLILPRIHERRVGVKVLQVSDILEYNGACSSKSVVILLVFLSFQLIVRRNSDQLNFHKLLGFRCQSPVRKRLSLEQCFEHSEAALNREDGHGSNTADGMRNFKFIMAWWQDMALRNRKFDPQPRIPPFRCLSTGRENSEMQIENAAIVIQSHFRHSTKRRNYLGLKTVVSFLQTVIRAWLVVKKKSANDAFCTNRVQEPSFERRKQSEVSARYVSFMLDRHNFVKLKRSAVIIQHATRAWISRRHHGGRVLTQYMTAREVVNAAIDVHNFVIQKSEKASIASEENEANDLQVKAASCIQLAWSNYLVRNSICHQHLAATKIQSFYRGWLIRKSFMSQKQVAIQLQSLFRCLTQLRGFQTYKTSIRSAIVIQSHVRGWIARRSAYRLKCLVVAIQSHCRGWTLRKEILMRKEALIKIQSAFRCMQCCKNFRSQRHAATEIQGFIRGQIARRRLLGASSHFKAVPSGHILTSRGCFLTSELSIFLWSVLKLQRWWRSVLTNMSRMKSAIIIQSHIRGWIARQEAFRERSHIIVIQSHWKGYLARKDSSWQLLDLRSRVKNSAANVDDGMRIINRLVVALSDLLSMRSVSGILHTCATLDMATEHSQKCCEKLVEAGAVDTLVKLIRSVSRSIPDQEVLKHALSTLRNLARYSHLAEVLIDSHVSVETILWELLRNKEEGYFIASELLKKICSNPKGVEAARNLPALVKRLHNLVEDLTRKAGNEKKSARVQARDKVERRLKEAAELLNLIANG